MILNQIEPLQVFKSCIKVKNYNPPPPLINQTYKGIHKLWDFRDDCTEIILSVSLYSWFFTTANSFLSFVKSFDKS